MVDDQVQPQFSEAVERKAEELRQKSFQDESKYIDNESSQRAKELVKALRTKEEKLYEQKVANIEIEKRKAEENLVRTESEFRGKIEEIIKMKADLRIEVFQEQRRRAEEERERQEEAERKRIEEEERIKREEEARRTEEERRRQAEEAVRLQEEEKKRKEEEQIRRREEEQRRREEEQRSKVAEKQERVRMLLTNASKYFEAGDYEHSLVEVAKALVNDPQNVEALELEARIKNLQQEFSQSPDAAKSDSPGRKAVTREKTIRPSIVEKKPSKLPMVIAITISAAILLTLIIFQLFRGTSSQPVRFAVLPWTSANGSLEDNILGSALAEEVSRQYKSVAPPIATDFRTVQRVVRGSPEPNREIFKYVERILIGEINRTGNNITVEVKLVDSSGKADWSNNYLRSWSGLAGLPVEIASQLSGALNVKSSEIKNGFKRQPASDMPDPYFFYLRATEMMHRRTSESIANAYTLFLEAAQQDPKFAEAYTAAGEALMIQFDNNWVRGDSIIVRVQRFAEGAISKDPQDGRAYVLLAKVAAQNKKYSTALAYLDSAAALSPNNCDINFERGKIHFRMGKYSEGLDAFTKALSLNVNDPEYLSTAAFANQLVGQFGPAVRYHAIASDFADDSTQYMTSEAIETITGNAELRINLGQRFISACERRFRTDPGDNQNLYRLARLRQLMGMANANEYLNTLVSNLQTGLARNPGDGVAMATLGLALTRKGQFSEALALTRRAVTMAPDNPEVLYKAAQVYSLQMYSPRDKKLNEDKKNEAVVYLRRAVRLNYMYSEIANADFYNLSDLKEFRSAIEEKTQ